MYFSVCMCVCVRRVLGFCFKESAEQGKEIFYRISVTGLLVIKVQVINLLSHLFLGKFSVKLEDS